MIRLISLWVVLCAALTAADREVVRTDWNGFQNQFSTRSLNGHSARITLAGGQLIKTNVLRVTDSAVVVHANRATRQWDSGKSDAAIPKGQVTSVQFGGRTGNKRIIGLLAGFGGGAAIGAAIAASSDVSEGIGIILIPMAAGAIAITGGVVGYFIGKAADRPGPEFVLSQ